MSIVLVGTLFSSLRPSLEATAVEEVRQLCEIDLVPKGNLISPKIRSRPIVVRFLTRFAKEANRVGVPDNQSFRQDAVTAT